MQILSSDLLVTDAILEVIQNLPPDARATADKIVFIVMPRGDARSFPAVEPGGPVVCLSAEVLNYPPPAVRSIIANEIARVHVGKIIPVDHAEEHGSVVEANKREIHHAVVSWKL
jgi:hypothetical protein